MKLRCLAAVFTVAAVRLFSQSLPVDQIRTVAEQAYLYAYPLVLMDVTRGTHAAGGLQSNVLLHTPRFPGPDSRTVIGPNADTLYSMAWIDVSNEPVLLRVPDSNGRYYMVQFLDAWTETLFVPGKRTTGTREGWFAVVGPRWRGTLPPSAQRIDSPTNVVWMLGRIQTNGPADYNNVHAIQRGFALMPLSHYPDGEKSADAAPAPAVLSMRPSVPLTTVVQQMTAEAFFRRFASLLALNPPHQDDGPMLAQLASIGIAPGKPFDTGALGPEGRKALDEGAELAKRRLGSKDSLFVGSGWRGMLSQIGRYGTNYSARALVARYGLGANPPEDAVYIGARTDEAGVALTGANRYRMHFEKSELPPVRAFWSVTMYGEDGFFVPNAENRYAIGNRDKLRLNEDGSLDIWIQKDSPGEALNSNWLPAPDGAFNLMFRLYWPEESVLTGRWKAPPVRRIEHSR